MSSLSPGALGDLLAQFMPHQRWFAGKGRRARFSAEPLAQLPGTAEDVTIWIARAHYDDGEEQLYQLPLVVRREESEDLAHALVGAVAHDGGASWIYDALHDKSLTGAWLTNLRAETDTGTLRFHRSVGADEIPVDAPSLVGSAEQSNTSLMFGDQLLLKVFRRLQPGINPDIEVHEALAPLDSDHVARLFGSVEATHDGARYSLAMAQQFLTSATDGWVLATTSVRDLMAEADLHADEAGADFAGEAYRLGKTLASVHEQLRVAFGSAELRDDALIARARAMHDRLEEAASIVEPLRDIAPALHRVIDRLDSPGRVVASQRIHGDLHLAQVLRTVTGWKVIDFEGEPMAGLDERRSLDTPLRDIAGMLRSFEYAGHYRLGEGAMDPQLMYRAGEWTARNRGAFLDGYAHAAGHNPRDDADVLAAYEADKAVYEAVYEARNRPTWLAIPLATLNRLAGGGQ